MVHDTIKFRLNMELEVEVDDIETLLHLEQEIKEFLQSKTSSQTVINHKQLTPRITSDTPWPAHKYVNHNFPVKRVREGLGAADIDEREKDSLKDKIVTTLGISHDVLLSIVRSKAIKERETHLTILRNMEAQLP